jgi:four helix bundle protein
MSIVRFEDQACWQEATSLAVEVYAVSKDGEFGRDFGFRDQLRRAAVSIASNIAEAKERETIAEFIRYLYIAKGSAGELKTQLQIAKEIGYLNQDCFKDLKERVEKPGAMIGALIKTLKRKGVPRAPGVARWSRTSRFSRESSAMDQTNHLQMWSRPTDGLNR